jgi:threonine dehydrogenase-like Zn-dependent dehydrogenase
MKAVVFYAPGDIRLEDVPEPRIQAPTDAIVRLTVSAICGTDLHMVRGTMSGMSSGTILGHEGVGVVESAGAAVRNLKSGDRVVIASTIACGYCSYCRAGYYAQCDNANPNGKRAGTAFFGGPEMSGSFDGLQAEFARIPFASVGLTRLPEEVSDDQAILLSDIFPTGYFGAELAEIKPGDTVAVFGCGPVGQFAICSALMMEAGRVLAIDGRADRLAMAEKQGAEIIDFNKEDPIGVLLEMTGGIGVDRVIDAVGVDAEKPKHGPATEKARQQTARFTQEREQIVSEPPPPDSGWAPGDAPSQALEWGVESLAKAGTLAVIGVYPQTFRHFPMGAAMMKNLTIKMGNCSHRRYIPKLVRMVRSGIIDPATILTHSEPLSDALHAFKSFDDRRQGWVKVKLQPGE